MLYTMLLVGGVAAVVSAGVLKTLQKNRGFRYWQKSVFLRVAYCVMGLA